MNITEIRNTANKSIDYTKFVPQKYNGVNANAVAKPTTDKLDIASKPQNWDQQILLNGLDILENNIQKTNTGRLLDKSENRPIEDFTEAIKELEAAKLDFFRSGASAAQANITPSTIYELLTES